MAKAGTPFHNAPRTGPSYWARVRRDAEKQVVTLTRLMSVLARNGFLPAEDVLEAVGTHQARVFASAFLEHTLAGGKSKDEALLEAMKTAYPRYLKKGFGGRATGPPKPETLVRHGYRNLERPDVCVAIEALYAERGFTPEKAADLHIQHIQGLKRKEVVRVGNGNIALGEDGKPLEVMVVDRPNYQALKDFETSITPRQSTKIEQNISGGVSLFGGMTQVDMRKVEPKVLEGE
jgi:hypothetical protein